MSKFIRQIKNNPEQFRNDLAVNQMIYFVIILFTFWQC